MMEAVQHGLVTTSNKCPKPPAEFGVMIDLTAMVMIRDHQ
jgi:hypothetical protein